MSLIQPILIAMILANGALLLFCLSSRPVSRAGVGVLVAGAVACVLRPNLTTAIAHRLGVGRGADLVFYICLLAGASALVHLYRRNRKLELAFTEVVREIALGGAREPVETR